MEEWSRSNEAPHNTCHDENRSHELTRTHTSERQHSNKNVGMRLNHRLRARLTITGLSLHLPCPFSHVSTASPPCSHRPHRLHSPDPGPHIALRPYGTVRGLSWSALPPARPISITSYGRWCSGNMVEPVSPIEMHIHQLESNKRLRFR